MQRVQSSVTSILTRTCYRKGSSSLLSYYRFMTKKHLTLGHAARSKMISQKRAKLTWRIENRQDWNWPPTLQHDVRWYCPRNASIVNLTGKRKTEIDSSSENGARMLISVRSHHNLTNLQHKQPDSSRGLPSDAMNESPGTCFVAWAWFRCSLA
jgi:hypothetical protein